MNDIDSPSIQIIDTSAFFLSIPLNGRLMTVSRVVNELKDLRGKARLDVLISRGLIVTDPGRDSITAVIDASEKSGDKTVLSETDIDVLALAYEMRGKLFTDDYALQNTARHMGVSICPILQKNSVKKKWRLRCSGCGKYYERMPEGSVCDVCGSPVKRKIK